METYFALHLVIALIFVGVLILWLGHNNKQVKVTARLLQRREMEAELQQAIRECEAFDRLELRRQRAEERYKASRPQSWIT